jgi:LysM repeat protein
MRRMKTQWFKFLVATSVFLLTSCQVNAVTPQSSLFGNADLTPFATTTLTPTFTSTSYDAPTATFAPTFTPTPLIYTVKEGETLFEIAANHGISTKSLQDANPNVNPYLLSEGMTLVIPGAQAEVGTQEAPGSTPYPLVVSEPNCSPSLSGGMYCFATLINEQPFMAGNISAEFALTDPVSGEVLKHNALVPLTRLASGGELPLFAYFEPPIFASPVARLTLKTATNVIQNGTPTPLQAAVLVVNDPGVAIAADGLSAVLNPSVTLNSANGQGGRLMVAAVAYNEKGQVVGIRRYESKNAVGSGESVTFTLNIYSIGGIIESVELFGEINP